MSQGQKNLYLVTNISTFLVHSMFLYHRRTHFYFNLNLDLFSYPYPYPYSYSHHSLINVGSCVAFRANELTHLTHPTRHVSLPLLFVLMSFLILLDFSLFIPSTSYYSSSSLLSLPFQICELYFTLMFCLVAVLTKCNDLAHQCNNGSH